MSTTALPPGPARRARLVAAGTNITLADFTETERAELDANAETTMAALRRAPDSPFFDAEAS